MFFVLEHMSDRVLDRVLPELARVCRGALFVQVPNRWQVRDDHTGLALVPWMPRPLAAAYVRVRGARHRYAISRDGSWDVWYRGIAAIRRRFARHGYRVEPVPDALVFPSFADSPPLFRTDGAAPLKRVAQALVRNCVRALDGPGEVARHPFLNLAAIPERVAR